MNDVLAVVVDNLRAAIDHNPQSLLLTGPNHSACGVPAHVVIADFIGHDDQIERDAVRLDRCLPVVLTPRPLTTARLMARMAEPPQPGWGDLDVWRWEPHGMYAIARISGELLPDEEYDPTTFLVTVLYVRYRRTN